MNVIFLILLLQSLNLIDLKNDSIELKIEKPTVLILVDNMVCTSCILKFKELLNDLESDSSQIKYNIYVIFTYVQKSYEKRNLINDFNTFNFKINKQYFDNKNNTIFNKFEFNSSPTIVFLEKNKYFTIKGKELLDVKSLSDLKKIYFNRLKSIR